MARKRVDRDRPGGMARVAAGHADGPGPSVRPAPQATSSAGRIGPVSRRRTRPRAPENAMLATVAKPCSSARSASSSGRCGRRRAGRGRRRRRTSSPRGARPTARAARPPRRRPTPEAPGLDHEARPGVQVARVVADEVAEQAEGGALGRRVGPRARAHDVRAARRVELRDDPGVREAHERHRRRQRLEREQQTAAARNGTTCATVVSVHSRPRRRRRASSTRGRQ